MRLVSYLLFAFLFIGGALCAQNFKNYSVESGLAQSQVYSLLQDRAGYLWVGTYGGGVSRFNGSGFKNLTVREGLLSNTIYSICEDHNGDLWFGTDNGLARYDGFTFKTYTMQDGLPGRTIYRVIEDRHHQLWLGTDHGAVRFDGKTFLKYSAAEGLTDGGVLTILEDKQGALWFGTEQSGLIRYDASRFVSIAGFAELGDITVNSLAQDTPGNIWIGTDKGGLASFDGKHFKRHPWTNGKLKYSVYCILADPDDCIWVGTKDGLSYFENERLETYTTKNGLSSKSVWALLQDREGNIWIGTDGGGLDRYRDFGLYQITASQGLSDNCVWSVAEDKNGNFWFATSAGLDRYDGSTFTNFPLSSENTKALVYAFIQDSKGSFWAGTDGNGVFKSTGGDFIRQKGPKELENANVFQIFEDREGRLWFATRNGAYKFDGSVYTRYTVSDGLLDDNVYAFFQDRNGELWGISVRGVNKYNGTGFARAFSEGDLVKGLTLCMTQDSDSSFWFGTDHGLYRYDGRIWESFTEKDGLSSNIIYSLAYDRDGNLWMGNIRGADKFDMASYKSSHKKIFMNYGSEEGLTGLECNQNAVTTDHLGNVWFGTIKGALACRPMIRRPNKLESLTHITELQLVNGMHDLKAYCDSIDRATRLPVNLKLSHDLNHLTIDFIGISLTAPSKVAYKYKLDGLDENWSEPTKDKKAVYSHLPPGEYTFQVKADNGEGVWNEQPTTLDFVIVPPFWQTWWFYSISVAGIVMIITSVIKIREKSFHKHAAELIALNNKLLEEISVRIHAEASLKQSETNFRTFAEMLPAAILVIRDKKIIYANPYTIKWSGVTREELGKLNFWDMIHPDDRDLVRTRGLGRQQGQQPPSRYEVKILTRHNEVNWCDIIVRVIEYDSLPALLVAATDITERKKAEDAILKARKIESLGILAGGIAHDFNNVLTAILGNISLARIKALKNDGAGLMDDLQCAEAASQQARGLTQQLLTFAKGGAPIKESTSIGDLLRDTANFVLAGSNVRCTFGISQDLQQADVDRGQISQVIHNLILNARQAMPNGGQLSVRAENVHFDAESYEHGQRFSAGEFVKIAIQDEGVGISSDNLAKIFDPYFTTKEKGSGLGLATAYSIIKNHGGIIYAESEIDKGTSFHIYLPAAKKTVVSKKTLGSSRLFGKGHILIMDDEDKILKLAESMLRHFGYEVVTATDAPSAVSAYQSCKENGNPFDLVIMDLTIPGGLGGKEAVKQILNYDPNAKVIVSSGYSNDPIMADYTRYGFSGVLPKPYTLEELSQTLLQTLQAKPPTA